MTICSVVERVGASNPTTLERRIVVRELKRIDGIGQIANVESSLLLLPTDFVVLSSSV